MIRKSCTQPVDINLYVPWKSLIHPAYNPPAINAMVIWMLHSP